MKNRKFSPLWVFVILMSGSIAFTVYLLIKTSGACLDTIVSGAGNDRYMDFFNHITYVRDPKNVYFSSEHACFPPLIYFMYLLFGKMLPQDATTMYNASLTSAYALLLYIVYCVILAVLLFYSVHKLAREKSIEWSLGMTMLILLSNAFIFGVLERGNSVLIVTILLMRALELREKDDRISRERALILIACSAGIKIYPAVFGLLYLVEKRWKEAGRLILYGLFFFFAPFAFFGGKEGMIQFVRNQMTIQAVGNGIGTVGAFWNLLTETQNGWVAVAGYLILIVAGCILTKDLWKRVCLLSSVMVVAPFWSGRYTTIYMVIPLILFFRESGQKVIDYIYAGLFACMFLLIAYSNTVISDYAHTYLPIVVERMAIYAMNIMVIAGALILSVGRKCRVQTVKGIKKG